MTDPTRSHLIALLHRAHIALLWPESLLDKSALISDISEAVTNSYPPRPKTQCWCGEQNCNEHSQFEVGDG